MKKTRILSFIMAIVTIITAFPVLGLAESFTASAKTKTTVKEITSFTIKPKYKLYTADENGNFRYKLYDFDRDDYGRYYDLTLYFSDGSKVPYDYELPLEDDGSGIGVDACSAGVPRGTGSYEHLYSCGGDMQIKLVHNLSKKNPWKAGNHTVTAKLYIRGKLKDTKKFTVKVVKCPTDIKTVIGLCEIYSIEAEKTDRQISKTEVVERYTNVKITYKDGKSETVDVYPSKRTKCKADGYVYYYDKFINYNTDFEVLSVKGKTVTACYKGHQFTYVIKQLSALAKIGSYGDAILYIVPGTTGYDLAHKGSAPWDFYSMLEKQKNKVLKTGLRTWYSACGYATVIAIGDLNGDGKITKADATKCTKDAKKLNKNKTSNAFYVADVNGDRKITKADSDIILKTAQGKKNVKIWIQDLDGKVYK